MKKLVLVGLLGLSSSLFAAGEIDYYLKAGASNYSVDGGDSTVASSVRLGMDINKKNSSIYMNMEFGATTGEIDGLKLDSMVIQYNIGYKTNKTAVYGLFGINSENDIYLEGSYFYGLGMKYSVTKNLGLEAEYSIITSASSTSTTEPDSSQVGVFISYNFATKTF